MKDSRVEYVTNLYPLIDRRITRAGCMELIKSEGLPIPPRSACYFCPFNSVERWCWLFENHPELYEKAMALEEHSKHFPSQRLTDQAFRHHANIPLRSLAEIFRKGGQLPAVPVNDQQPCGAECLT